MAFTNAAKKLFKDADLAAILLLYFQKQKGFCHDNQVETKNAIDIWIRKMTKFIRIVVEETDLDENRVCLIIKAIVDNLVLGKKMKCAILAEVFGV